MKRILGLAIYAASVAILVAFVNWQRVLTQPSWTDLLIHLVASLVATLGIVVFFSRRNKVKTLLLIFASQVFLPFLAMVFTLALLITIILSKKMDLLGGYHEEDESIVKGLEKPEVDDAESAMQQNMNVEPIVEIIRGHSNPEIKRGAIETLTNICNPDSIGLLKECLRDDNLEVRFYASSGLARIEERLNDNIIKHQKLVKLDASMDHYYELGKAYYDFVYLGLQDKASLLYYLNQAIDNFEKARKYPSVHEKVHLALQRAYSVAGRYREARMIHETHFSHQLSSVNNIMYLAENYFNEGRIKECKALLEMTKDQAVSWERVQDVRDMWSQIQKEEAGE